MSAIRNIIMDLGGVMLDWNPDRLLTRFEPDPGLRTQLRAAIFGPEWRLFDRGHISEGELVDRLALGSGQSRAIVLEIVEAARGFLLEKPETVKLVRDLRQRGLDIYCLSNMPLEMYGHLRRQHSFWDVFQGVVISGEVRMMKPEPEIFVHLLERFGLQAQESVFIDDLQANVDGARGVGMHAIRFHDAAQCEQELEELLLRTS